MEVDMKFAFRSAAATALFLATAAAFARPPGGPAAFTVPMEYHKLDNGLRVVLSRDTSAPKAVVAGRSAHRGEVHRGGQGDHRRCRRPENDRGTARPLRKSAGGALRELITDN
jgi:hypothetical protein